MCGFAGFLGGETLSIEESNKQLAAMTEILCHRGPDDHGTWFDTDARIWLGFRRLSIVDLSQAGHQPMASASGRYVVALNGEIYNHVHLRKQLAAAGLARAWRGHSDTETLLAGFDAFGIQAMVERCIGMFAIAVWDRETYSLVLARDRMGEKPLYYGWQGVGSHRVFLFGSEASALKAHPAFGAEINRDAICLLLRHSYIPAPYSIYKDIFKLEPGYLLSVSSLQSEPKIWAYWRLEDAVRSATGKHYFGSPKEAVDELEDLLKDAVAKQMVADVPLGAFLSGGIDSSTIVALMQAQSPRPVKTFTIGFHEEGYNEAVHAKQVAQYLGTDHTELYVTYRQAMDVIPKLPTLYSEPFADSSQIPTFLVSQLARQYVTVSLSGDAGDELFAGYNRYMVTAKLWRHLAKVPTPLRMAAARAIEAVSPAQWDEIARFIPGAKHLTGFGDKMHKGAGVLVNRSINDVYMGLVSHQTDPERWVIGGKEPPTHLTGRQPTLDGLDPVERMMALDAITYLPDDILAKLDRAAMGVSLESRVPFLDHRIVEFAWRVPLKYKLLDGQTKWLLRQVLHRYLPRSLIDRPKSGFGIPLHLWLRGALRDWAEALLDESRLRREGFFNPSPIRRIWDEHLSGSKNFAHHLWDILMFQLWFEHSR
jgi:asparagine synthase (glutamine-hydrolysing)